MERGRNDKTPDTQRQQTRCCLSNCSVEELLDPFETPEKEGHAHDKQQIRQDTADQGGLNDDNLVLDESNHRNDQFNRVTASYVSALQLIHPACTDPKVAFRSPPSVSPNRNAISSVA